MMDEAQRASLAWIENVMTLANVDKEMAEDALRRLSDGVLGTSLPFVTACRQLLEYLEVGGYSLDHCIDTLVNRSRWGGAERRGEIRIAR